MNINEKLQAAMKGLTSVDLGASKLNNEKSDKFLKVLADASPVLDAARRITMGSHTRDIDRISFGANLVKGTEGVEPAEGAKANFKTNKLIVEEYVMVQNLTDSAIEDSIDQLDDVIVELMGNQAGFDLEGFGLTKWIANAGNVYDGTVVGNELSGVEAGFDKAIQSLPAKYDRNRGQLKLFVTRDIEDAYRDVLRARGTQLGDAAQTGAGGLAYKGIELVVVPGMAAGTVLLVNPSNLVYGVFREIRIEEDRNAKARATDFVLSLRADFNFENEEAAVVVKGVPAS